MQARGLLQARGRQRTDATQVLAALSAFNRLELGGAAMRAALHRLAEAAPGWWRLPMPPEWYTRYGARLEDYRLPQATATRQALAPTMGAAGVTLLRAVSAPTAPAALRGLPAVAGLRQSWGQHDLPRADGVTGRDHDHIPPAAPCVSAPSDPEAHDARKPTPQGGGDTVPLTAPCDAVLPPLLTHVDTTSAPVDASPVTAQLHASLQEQALLPSWHLVATGDREAELLATSQRDDGVARWGPTRQAVCWPAHVAGGCDVSPLVIHGDQQDATCPADHSSISWSPAIDNRDNAVITMTCSRTDGRPGRHRSQCTRAQRYPRRTITVRPRAPYDARKAARERQCTAPCAQDYARRAGSEGTRSYGSRACG